MSALPEYRPGSIALTWQDAEAYCREQSAWPGTWHLAQINSSEEVLAIRRLIGQPGRYWLGGIFQQGQWRWAAKPEPWDYEDWQAESWLAREGARLVLDLENAAATGSWLTTDVLDQDDPIELNFICESADDSSTEGGQEPLAVSVPPPDTAGVSRSPPQSSSSAPLPVVPGSPPSSVDSPSPSVSPKSPPTSPRMQASAPSVGRGQSWNSSVELEDFVVKRRLNERILEKQAGGFRISCQVTIIFVLLLFFAVYQGKASIFEGVVCLVAFGMVLVPLKLWSELEAIKWLEPESVNMGIWVRPLAAESDMSSINDLRFQAKVYLEPNLSAEWVDEKVTLGRGMEITDISGSIPLPIPESSLPSPASGESPRFTPRLDDHLELKRDGRLEIIADLDSSRLEFAPVSNSLHVTVQPLAPSADLNTGISFYAGPDGGSLFAKILAFLLVVLWLLMIFLILSEAVSIVLMTVVAIFLLLAAYILLVLAIPIYCLLIFYLLVAFVLIACYVAAFYLAGVVLLVATALSVALAMFTLAVWIILQLTGCLAVLLVVPLVCTVAFYALWLLYAALLISLDLLVERLCEDRRQHRYPPRFRRYYW